VRVGVQPMSKISTPRNNAKKRWVEERFMRSQNFTILTILDFDFRFRSKSSRVL
jgi:hypothetical protein